MRRGISNRQAKFLASLQRQLREPYTGRGMSRATAAGAIDDALQRLGRDPTPVKSFRAGPDFPWWAGERAYDAPRARREAIRNSSPMPKVRARSDAPLDSQLHDLRVLARRVGEPVPEPETRAQASSQLVRLRRLAERGMPLLQARK